MPRVMGSIPPQRGLTVPHALRADNNSHSIGDRFAIAPRDRNGNKWIFRGGQA